MASSIVQQKRLQARLEINTAFEAVLNHYFNYQGKNTFTTISLQTHGDFAYLYYLTLTQA